MALATCETLGEGLKKWLEEASSSDVEALCDALKNECDLGDELPEPPNDDGKYALTVEVDGGDVTYSWEDIGC